MKITSEIIQINLDRLDKTRKQFKILDDYYNETDEDKLKKTYSLGRSYGLLTYLSFIDFIRYAKKNNQQPFYDHKIKLKEFKDCLISLAPDPTVKKVLKSKGKASFEKFINSKRWELYSGNITGSRRRRGVRFNDNFVLSSPIIANYCIQNELEIEDSSRISNWYTQQISVIDPSLVKEIEITNNVVDFIYQNMVTQDFDFKKLNIDNIIKNVQYEIEFKMTQLDKGEAVKLSDETDYYSGLTNGKVYVVENKTISNGRLNVSIKNDLGFTREYPYRLFETVTNLRNAALDELLNDL
jgi:hypothetical protein